MRHAYAVALTAIHPKLMPDLETIREVVAVTRDAAMIRPHGRTALAWLGWFVAAVEFLI